MNVGSRVLNGPGVDKNPRSDRNFEATVIFLLFQGRKPETRVVLVVPFQGLS